MKLLKIAAIAGAMMVTGSAADAAIVVNVTQAGGDVHVDTSGSVDLTGLTLDQGYGLDTSIGASIGYVSGGNGGTVLGFTGFSGPSSFGPGRFVDATTSTGDNFAFNASAFGQALIFLPMEYFPGTEISSSQIFSGQTFASLGLNTGSYVFRSAADTVTVNIGPVAAAVPEPATWALMILGMGAVGFAMRRRKNVTTTVRFA